MLIALALCYYIYLLASLQDIKKYSVNNAFAISLVIFGLGNHIISSIMLRYSFYDHLLYIYYIGITLGVCYILDKYRILGAGDLKLLLATSFVISYSMSWFFMPVYILTIVALVIPTGAIKQKFKIEKVPYVPVMFTSFVIVSLFLLW